MRAERQQGLRLQRMQAALNFAILLEMTFYRVVYSLWEHCQSCFFRVLRLQRKETLQASTLQVNGTSKSSKASQSWPKVETKICTFQSPIKGACLALACGS